MKKALISFLFLISGFSICVDTKLTWTKLYDNNPAENHAIDGKEIYEQKTHQIAVMVDEVLDLYQWPYGKPNTWVYFIKHDSPASVVSKISDHNCFVLVDYAKFIQHSVIAQQFIIAHEIAHYKQNEESVLGLNSYFSSVYTSLHSMYQLLYFAAFVFSYGSYSRYISDFVRLPYSIKVWHHYMLLSLQISWIIIIPAWISNKIRQNKEYDSDERAAKALCTIEGGLDFFNYLSQKKKSSLDRYPKITRMQGKEPLFITKILKRILRSLVDGGTHPREHHRVEALQELDIFNGDCSLHE